MQNTIKESELILNADGSVYHLNLLPEDIASTIIFVGDPERVSKVSQFFSNIEVKKQKREFVTHTGTYNNKRVTVISTGIGTDNIDIVFNELDALVNVDLNTRILKDTHTALDIVRVGTSGCLQPNIPVDSVLLSSFGLGLEGLLNYYNRTLTESEEAVTKEFQTKYESIYNKLPITPQFAQASQQLLSKFQQRDVLTGITTTCSGFYAPQGRAIRLQPANTHFLDELQTVQLGKHQITNFEMETAGIYGLANLLGHNALSINCLIANRAQGTFSKQPKQIVEKTIEWTLNKLTE